MNILLFGPQCSGKGTQAELLVKQLGFYHLSTGNEMRSEMSANTPMGQKIKELINSGMLAPDDITNKLVLNKFETIKTKKGVIFDGYPRSYEQWLFVKKNFAIDLAIEIHIEDEEAARRMSLRRICPKCKRNYNLVSIKPKVDGYCDVDNTKLVSRDDDTADKIKKRLALYHSQTEPLKKEYIKLGMLHVINGNQSINRVHKDILQVLNSLK